MKGGLRRMEGRRKRMERIKEDEEEGEEDGGN